MNKALLASFVLLAASAVGQYTTSHYKSFTDITSYATSGTDAWKYMPGNPVCAPGTLSTFGIGIWCMGANNGPPYEYSLASHSWIGHPEMGTAPARLILAKNALYSLQVTSTCGWNYGGSQKQSYDLFVWNSGAWTQPHAGSCMFEASTDIAGGLFVVGWDGNRTSQCPNGCTALFTSTDGGATWNFWSDLWSYVNQWGAGLGCGINNANQLYLLSNKGPNLMPSLPSGSPVGCLLAYDPNGSMMIAWNGSGKVFEIELNPNSAGWSTISGSAKVQVSGGQKGVLIALDGAGKPYHWNVFAPYISATTSGTYPYCASSPILCQNQTTPVHLGKLWHKFSSGHGINYHAGIQTQLVAPNTKMNLTSWDIAPQCDPLLGHPDDPECTSDTYGSEHCNVANADLPQNPTQNPTPPDNESIAISGFATTNSETGPYPTGWSTPIEGAWYGIVNRNYFDACFEFGPNEPTCPEDYSVPFNKVMLQAYHSAQESDLAYDEIAEMMGVAVAGEDMPVIVWQPYAMVNGVAVCTGQRREQESFGFLPAIPACK